MRVGFVDERDVRAGGPRLVCRAEWGPITAAQVAFYCAAVGVADPIHYNVNLARGAGFDRLVVNGSFRWALMTLTAGECLGGFVAESSCRHRAPMDLGATVVVELELTEPARDGHCVLAGRNVVDGSVVDTSRIVLRMAE